MRLHILSSLCLAALLTLGSGLWALGSAAEGRPNILLFFVDDLGQRDLSCYGSTFHETPHIDKLAATGLRFTDAYTAASICSPTRAALMTGKHPVRVDITDWIPGCGKAEGRKLLPPEDTHQLPLGEFTIGEAFRENGYATFYTGKWHLGGKGFSPDLQGFDTCYDPHNDSSKGSPGKGKTTGRPHGTTDLTRETIKFIREQNAADKPFFAIMAYYDIHTPIIPVENRLPHYQAKADRFSGILEPIMEHDGLSRPRQDNPELATMVEAVDNSVGKVLRTLDELEIADDTIVVFYSDNGGLCTLGRKRSGPGCNLPLRSGKGWLYEGGIRVPLIIRDCKKLPGSPPTARGTSPQLVTTMDLYPSLLWLADLPQQGKQHVDGLNIGPLLRGQIHSPPRTLHWHYPHYHGSAWTPGAAIRDGSWKLIQFYEPDKVELYDLSQDPGEQTDLSQTHPEKTKALLQKLHTWQREMGAKLPTER